MSPRIATHAFGLPLDAGFPIDGCPAADTAGAGGSDRVRVDLAEPDDLARAFATGGQVIARRRTDTAAGWVDDVVAHPASGYLIDDGEVGRFAIDINGSRVRCAPGPVERWRWQRHLIGRALPLAAVLRGFEPWHASAVATESGAIVLAGDAGRGKSTLAIELVIAGGRLITDDVLALEVRDGQVVGHPGAGVISVRTATADRLTQAELARLGTEIGRDEHARRIVTDRAAAPCPVAAVVLLDGGDPVPEPLLRLDPRRLLASTFDFVTVDPDRLVRQLDVCSVIARQTPVVRLGSGPGREPRRAAERLRRVLAALGPGGST